MTTHQIAPTVRLYFTDPYLQEFTAQVVARHQTEDHWLVALDRSAFYPEGGGQLPDHGTLNGVPVTDVQVADEIVWHHLPAPLLADEVHGLIDWPRRFDFMQQHHGQHLLSAAFEQLFGAPTVAVHLGEESCTVDIENTSLSPDQLVAAEEWTNRVIYDDLPVHVRFVTPEELASLALRRPPKVHDRVRIVSAGDVDHSACGGTHPRRTGEVGIVALRRWERRGDSLRIEFICGSRALHDYRAKTAIITTLANELSVAAVDLPAALQRVRLAEETSRKALASARRELCVYEAQASLAAATEINGMPVVAQVLHDRPLDEVRLLARAIADGGGIALLALAGDKAQFVFSRATTLHPDMGALLRTAAAIVGGKGGGKADAAQGGGPNVALIDVALAAAVEALQDVHS
ncbi:MAG: alanyl-tRNA editing protein [Herpetosiphonaceae bacterium]|nr:alanyl-tRNA editing protein [Herpetosiphonaceae bacterium]